VFDERVALGHRLRERSEGQQSQKRDQERNHE
jgi:hypothetical protein